MTQLRISGRVWTFGSNISTDLMLPGGISYSVAAGTITPEELAPYCMHSNRPDWAGQVRPGDVLVAGTNFGCGSSRPAYKSLQAVGVQLVVADSVAGLFYRTCINAGFPVVACPGISRLVEEGEEITVDLAQGVVTVDGTDRHTTFAPLREESPPMQILMAGGLIPYMKARLNLGQPAAV
jgi:3-isopropylmalate/(R)-2-methylmalate dehydratase small subunit